MKQRDADVMMPRHVALICDGNSRWARARNLPAVAGHAAGAERSVQVLRALRDTGQVTHCTMYAFSTENWKRPESEIRDIWTVMEQTAKRLYSAVLEENMILRVVGDLSDDRIPASLREILQSLEQETLEKSTFIPGENGDTPVTLCLAINYGGRQDILNASKRLAKLIANGEVDPDSVTEETFAACLDTSNVPDPDLIIRTSGEKRLSNFLLWNAAYAELYFTDTLWPDFDAASVRDALDWFSKRRRRFGAHQDVADHHLVAKGRKSE
jgi:undecaprenyl diphosphate synthase